MRIIKNYLYNCSYQLLSVLIPLLTTPYLSRVLLANNIGISSYVLSISTIFSTIGLIGLTNYSAREIAYVRDDKNNISKTFWELFFLRIICFSVTIIFYIILLFNSDYKYYLLLQTLWLFSTFIDFTWFFIGIEDFKVPSFRNIFIKILNLVLIFVFIKNESDLGRLLIINGGCQFVGSIFVLPIILRKIKKVKLNELQIIRHLLPSIKVLLPQIAGLLYLEIDKVMIEYITGSAKNVGYYYQAEKIIKIPLTIITTISTVLMPRVAFSFKKEGEINKYINSSIYMSLLLAYPLMFGIMAIADNFVPWFFGNDFAPVTDIMKWLALIIVFISMTSISSNQYFIATNKPKILTYSYIMAGILNLIINFISIPIFGVYGAIVGTIFAEITAFIIQFFNMRNKVQYILSFKKTFSFLLYSIIMYIIINQLGTVLDKTLTTTSIQIFIGISIYIILLFICRKKHIKDFKSLLQ